jgi:sugar phosphate isomerase/epimerase
LIEFGIFAKTFSGTEPATVLGAVRRAGYRTAQYNMACSGLASMPDEIPPDAVEAVASAAQEAGVRIAAISATYNMIHPDTEARRRGHASLAVIAAAASAMGTRLLTLCTGTRDPDDQWRGHPDNGSPEAWRDLLESMEIAVEIAERHDVLLGIEPEQANVVDSAARAQLLIDELQSLRVRIVFDPANLIEEESAEARRRVVSDGIEMLGDRMAMAHAKDRLADGRVVAAGHGIIDFPHYVHCLRGVGFDGPLVAHGLSTAEAPNVATALRAWLDAA